MQQILFQRVEVTRPLIAKDAPCSDYRRKRPPPVVITSSSHGQSHTEGLTVYTYNKNKKRKQTKQH